MAQDQEFNYTLSDAIAYLRMSKLKHLGLVK